MKVPQRTSKSPTNKDKSKHPPQKKEVRNVVEKKQCKRRSRLACARPDNACTQKVPFVTKCTHDELMQVELDEVNEYECDISDRAECCKTRARPFSRQYRGRTYCSNKPQILESSLGIYYMSWYWSVLNVENWRVYYTSRSIYVAVQSLIEAITTKGLKAGTEKLLKGAKVTVVTLLVAAIGIVTQCMCTSFFSTQAGLGLVVFQEAVKKLLKTNFADIVKKAYDKTRLRLALRLAVLGAAEEEFFRNVLPEYLEMFKPAMFSLLDKYYENPDEDFKENKVKKWFKILYLIVCSVMFGLYHYSNVDGEIRIRNHCQVVFTTVVGFFFHWMRDKAGIRSAVAMHFIHNLVKVALSPDWLNLFVYTSDAKWIAG